MAILLAAGAAIGWGASDYFGGDASRRDTPVFVVVAVAELLGVLLVLPFLIGRGNPPPDDPRLLLAAVAGLAVTVELSLIYRALSRGAAFITAPTGALGAAAAVTVGLIAGDPLSLALAIGLVCALLGAAVSAWTSPVTGRRSRAETWGVVATCLGAAAAVGAMLVSLHAAGRLDPYWATATEHASTGVSAGLAALVGTRRTLRNILPGRRQLPTLALIATVGVGGDLPTRAPHTTGRSAWCRRSHRSTRSRRSPWGGRCEASVLLASSSPESCSRCRAPR
ncbi:MAG: EamA family transporter [Solirubrobacterales bacterium]|nr:EamA family transporter [Solirubrobacterales bacterium]